jgi:hypothetical protein
MILRTAKGSALTYEEMDSNLTYLDNTKVNKTTDETIAGIKTFTSPIQGNLVGNATSATKLQTPRTINGVAFDGTQNIIIPAQTLDGVAINTQPQTFTGVKTFSDGLITDISGNSGTTDKFKIGRKINGVMFDGSQDITIPFDTDSFVTLSTNQTISGQKSFSVSPTAPTPPSSDNSTKVATTEFVKTALIGFSGGSSTPGPMGPAGPQGPQGPMGPAGPGSSLFVSSGMVVCSGGFTSKVGYQPESTEENYADVFPPTGYTMDHFKGVIPSIRNMWFAGTVNSDDISYCISYVMTDRIRIQCGNSEQRAAAQANYVTFWQK